MTKEQLDILKDIKITNGQIILNFNHEGFLMDVEVRQKVYKRKNILALKNVV